MPVPPSGLYHRGTARGLACTAAALARRGTKRGRPPSPAAKPSQYARRQESLIKGTGGEVRRVHVRCEKDLTRAKCRASSLPAPVARRCGRRREVELRGPDPRRGRRRSSTNPRGCTNFRPCRPARRASPRPCPRSACARAVGRTGPVVPPLSCPSFLRCSQSTSAGQWRNAPYYLTGTTMHGESSPVKVVMQIVTFLTGDEGLCESRCPRKTCGADPTRHYSRRAAAPVAARPEPGVRPSCAVYGPHEVRPVQRWPDGPLNPPRTPKRDLDRSARTQERR